MRKFLIGNNIGGAVITKQAFMYLIQKQFSQPVQQSFLNVWDEYANSKDATEIHLHTLPYNRRNNFRKILQNLVELLNYDYSEFDALNNDYSLRIVEVPNDGVEYHILEDAEYGCEYVSQYHKTIYAKPDWYMKAKYAVKRFFLTFDFNESNQQESINYNDVVIKLDGNYGIAEFAGENGEKSFFLLKKAEYYAETEDHQKITYDIVNESFDYSHKDVFTFSELESYRNLIERS